MADILNNTYLHPTRNNFLRLCVLKVTQLSEKHLEKILNVDEFVKRVFSVIHSNDPVARAITLRFTVFTSLYSSEFFVFKLYFNPVMPKIIL